MKVNKLIKSEARKTLSDKWGIALGCYFSILLVYLIFSSIYNISFILTQNNFQEAYNNIPENFLDIVLLTIFPFISFIVLLLLTPVFSGITLILTKSTLNKPVEFSNILYYFSKENYKKSVKLWIRLIARCIVPIFFGLLFCITIYNIAKTAESEIIGNILYSVLIVGIFVFTLLSINIISTLFLAPFIHVSNTSYSSTYCIGLSIKIMKNNKGKIYFLLLSFIPWILISFFVVPTLYTIPYIFTSFATSAKYIITNNLKEF